jgi:hypothetical protein
MHVQQVKPLIINDVARQSGQNHRQPNTCIVQHMIKTACPPGKSGVACRFGAKPAFQPGGNQLSLFWGESAWRKEDLRAVEIQFNEQKKGLSG